MEGVTSIITAMASGGPMGLELTVSQIFEIVGFIGATSFIFIAASDFLIAAADIVVNRLFASKKSAAAKKVVFIWSLLKDVYEEFRKFIDKLSAYSRPRKPGGEASNELKP